jgi:hypothetical protein
MPTLHPTPCPSWCRDPADPRGPHHGPRSTVHWSEQAVLLGQEGGVMARAELFRMDEGDREGEVLLVVSMEQEAELTAADADGQLDRIAAWLDEVRALRKHLF